MMIKLIILFFLLSSFPANAAILLQDNFESYTTTISGGDVSTWGSQTTLDTTGGYGGSKCAKTIYGTAGVNSGTSLNNAALEVGELYIRFYAKVDCGTGICAGGTKFLKFFSISTADPVGYANSTMRLVYESGNIEGIAAGSGTELQNDDGNVMFLDGSHLSSPDVNMNTGEVTYIGNYSGHKDGQWHAYEVYMKFNTDGNTDGEYKIWIDGVYKLHATNVKNRNDANVRAFDAISLGGYSSAPQWTTSFTIWFDEVVISTEPIGLLNSYVFSGHRGSVLLGR